MKHLSSKQLLIKIWGSKAMKQDDSKEQREEEGLWGGIIWGAMVSYMKYLRFCLEDLCSFQI